MAHFAQINSENVVIRVVKTADDKPNEGYDWLVDRFGGTWIKTSYNTYGGEHLNGGTPLRKNFAGVGYTYDSERDAFLLPQPHASWTLDEETCLWVPPVPYPEDDKEYQWDEAQQNWVEITAE